MKARLKNLPPKEELEAKSGMAGYDVVISKSGILGDRPKFKDNALSMQ
jgi:hypothetical protein